MRLRFHPAPYDRPPVLDYHLHLWPHGERHRQPTLDQLHAYCEAAKAKGVTEVAITEHFFRFVQADTLLHGFWEDEPNPVLRHDMEGYWRDHVGADLDSYVGAVLDAKQNGLPVVLGLEVDHYAGRMDKVAALLEGYPFDVLLGSVHWIGGWLFDALDRATAMHEWDSRPVEEVWRAYEECLVEVADSAAVDVLAHPDLVKVTGRRPADPGFLADCDERIAELAARTNVAAEVNSNGWRKPVGEAYPSRSLLARFRHHGVPITTASDAHALEHVAFRTDDVRRLITEAGYTHLHAFRDRKGHAVPL